MTTAFPTITANAIEERVFNRAAAATTTTTSSTTASDTDQFTETFAIDIAHKTWNNTISISNTSTSIQQNYAIDTDATYSMYVMGNPTLTLTNVDLGFAVTAVPYASKPTSVSSGASQEWYRARFQRHTAANSSQGWYREGYPERLDGTYSRNGGAGCMNCGGSVVEKWVLLALVLFHAFFG
ncbi:uncharacterized protein LODBEIA_P54040 [Lodderomyces beijingensis]|uniref:Uncharacterized protein n=1 Tax=Lodderomyces beijingensis TaxID=1775926 RepID=A0ABP0ZV84_9ASCO